MIKQLKVCILSAVFLPALGLAANTVTLTTQDGSPLPTFLHLGVDSSLSPDKVTWDTIVKDSTEGTATCSQVSKNTAVCTFNNFKANYKYISVTGFDAIHSSGSNFQSIDESCHFGGLGSSSARLPFAVQATVKASGFPGIYVIHCDSV